MSKNKIDMYIAGLYSETQMSVYEEALHLIEAVGDSDSKAVAAEALTIAGMLEKASAPRVAASLKSEAQVKAKAKSKPKSKAMKQPKKTEALPKDTVTVSVMPGALPLNGAAEVPDRLLAWRKSEALSQKAAAAKAEVSISSWQAWESGKWGPAPEQVRRLEKLGV